MVLCKTLLKTQNPFCNFPLPFSICRTLTSSSTQSQTDRNKKPLRLLFQEAVDLSEKTEINISAEPEGNDVKGKLWELEKEVRDLKAADSNNSKTSRNVEKSKELKKPRSLYGVFTGDKSAEKLKIQRKEHEQPRVFKELSDDVRMFATYLYKEGYFIDANFLRRGKLDFSCFDDSYGRDYIKFAAENFGKDNQEIAKWLSGSDLKKLALFGCPSLGRKNVFSAKRLRKYFEIQEKTVCGNCVLKRSCKYANQSVWGGGDYKTLDLAVVMRVITLYALEASHPDLSVPEEIKASVSRLLKEAVRLSQSMS